MLEVVPTGWFSWDFTISEGSRPVAEFDISWWRERGELTVQGSTFRVSREGMLSGDFLLESDRGILARATKPSVLRRSFTVQSGTKTYTLQARSAFRRSFVLLDDDREVGAIAPHSAWTRRASANLPTDMPLPVQVFLVWLTLLLWKRESDSEG
jgi:hypothetical protein